jgi:hypothetical protein
VPFECNPDIVLAYRKSNNHELQYVAVVELKTLFALKVAEFKAAMARDWADARATHKIALDSDIGTYFDRNPLTLMQQAVKYNPNATPNVRIFDWRTMFLVDFTTLDPVTRGVEVLEGGFIISALTCT